MPRTEFSSILVTRIHLLQITRLAFWFTYQSPRSDQLRVSGPPGWSMVDFTKEMLPVEAASWPVCRSLLGCPTSPHIPSISPPNLLPKRGFNKDLSKIQNIPGKGIKKTYMLSLHKLNTLFNQFLKWKGYSSQILSKRHLYLHCLDSTGPNQGHATAQFNLCRDVSFLCLYFYS